MSAGNEQTELRALARYLDAFPGLEDDVDLLRRAADRLDRLNALVAFLEEEGDAL